MSENKRILVESEYDLNKLKNLIKTNWVGLMQEHPGIFRYKLNIRDRKVLAGNFKFIAQVLYYSMPILTR